MQIEEFTPLFEKLCHAFDRDLKDGQAMVYYEYIHTFSAPAMKYAVDQSILFHKYPRLPFVSELIDIMKEYKITVPIERQLQSNEVATDRNVARDFIAGIKNTLQGVTN